MASTKAHQVDAYLAKPPAHAVVLIFGPDAGLVSERATRVAQAFGADIDDPFAAIRLDADEAAADPDRVADEANTISMFGGKRLVWIRGSTQRNLAKALAPVLSTPPDDALVLIEQGDLKPSAGLRKAVEASPAGMALPCYRDEGAALDTMIDEEMREAGLTLERDARDELKARLGADRLASRGEVRKLALFAMNEGTVTLDHVESIVGDTSLGALDAFVDAVATGREDDAQSLMVRLVEGGTAEVPLAGALQRHFTMLHRARAAMDGGGRDAGGVVAAMRPPVNFKRKPDVVSALQAWRMPKLDRALARINRTAFEVRAEPQLARARLGTTVMALTQMAQRR